MLTNNQAKTMTSLRKAFVLLAFIFPPTLASAGYAHEDETSQAADAQETEMAPDSVQWTNKGSFGVMFSTVGLHQWAAGGQNSISLGTVASFKATRNTRHTLWKSQADLAFGIVRQAETDFPIRKTDDNVQLQTEYGYKFNEKWNASASALFRTQFTVGYEYKKENDLEFKRKISDLMAPGYLTLNAYFQYTDDKKGFTMAIAPLSNRITFVLSDSLSSIGAFGVEKGKQIRSQLGMGFRAQIDRELFKNIGIKSNLNTFAGYHDLSRWVVNWDILVVMKVNRYISTNFGTQLIYDPDVAVPRKDGTKGPGLQAKYVMNVGFNIAY